MLFRTKRRRVDADTTARIEVLDWWDTHSSETGHTFKVGPILTLDESAYRIQCEHRYCRWAHETEIEK